MISSLSGGNQQKVIFGKWLEREPQVFMMDEPTRGIDVGAKYEIYELIIQMAKQGKTIIVVNRYTYSRRFLASPTASVSCPTVIFPVSSTPRTPTRKNSCG